MTDALATLPPLSICARNRMQSSPVHALLVMRGKSKLAPQDRLSGGRQTFRESRLGFPLRRFGSESSRPMRAPADLMTRGKAPAPPGAFFGNEAQSSGLQSHQHHPGRA
jgi:hypothetical protein